MRCAIAATGSLELCDANSHARTRTAPATRDVWTPRLARNDARPDPKSKCISRASYLPSYFYCFGRKWMSFYVLWRLVGHWRATRQRMRRHGKRKEVDKRGWMSRKRTNYLAINRTMSWRRDTRSEVTRKPLSADDLPSALNIHSPSSSVAKASDALVSLMPRELTEATFSE